MPLGDGDFAIDGSSAVLLHYDTILWFMGIICLSELYSLGMIVGYWPNMGID